MIVITIIIEALWHRRSVQRIANTFSLIFIALAFLNFSFQTSKPTNQPSAFAASNRTTNSITVSFGNAVGNPSGYLLIYKTGSSPTNGAPIDGANYLVGTSLGGGTVGAKGLGPFNITGLAAGVQYFFDIYSYNGTGGGVRYLQTVAPLEGNAWTIAAEPTSSATNLTFNSVTATGFNGSFLAASPIPSGGYIGLRKAGSSVTDVPVDGTAYSVGSSIGASTVAFMGPSISFSETNLAPFTTYYYKIFSTGLTADPSTANYHTSGTPLVNNETTLATPASIQAAGIVFNPVANNQITLSWTNGNGAKRIVLGHAASTIDSNPVNATTYAANSSFASGSQIGTGNYVVYDGTGNTVTVTNLSASASYYFEVYEYNGVGLSANYFTPPSSGNPANQMTVAAPATVQASTILFTGTSSSLMTLSWTNGNGARRIILAHSGSAVNASPTNGATYSANSFFGSGSVIGVGNYTVYDGTGSSATVSGLSPSQVYDFQIYEYNGSGNTTNYLTTTAVGNPAGQTTLATPATLQASNIFTTKITNNSATLSWTKGNGARRMVLAKAGSTINANPVANTGYTASAIFGSGTLLGTGNYIVYDGTDSTVAVTGLSAATTYYFEVFEYNGAALTANYLVTTAALNPSHTITLAAPATIQAFDVVFSAIANTQFTIGWANGNGSNRLVLIEAGSQSNDAIANATSYAANAVFGSGASIGSHFVVYNGTGNSVTVTGLAVSTFYYVEIFEYNGSTTTANYLTSVATANPTYQSTLAVPVSIQASGVLFSNIFNHQATLAWTNGNGAKRLVLAHANSSVNASPSNATNYADNSVFGMGSQIGAGNFVVYNGTANSVSVTGLASDSAYYFKVFECNGTGADNNFNTSNSSGNPGHVLTVTDAPVASAVLAIGSTSFTVTWIPVVGCNGYQIDISTDNFSTFIPGYHNFAVTGTTVSVSALTLGTTYQCYVRAGNATGPSANSNLLTILTQPAAPIPYLGSGATATSFNANWSPSNGASAYFLDVSMNINFESFVSGFDNQHFTTTNSALVAGLTPGTIYYYRLRAENSGGTSGNSPTITQITVPGIPVIQNASNEQVDHFIANWAEVHGASGYELDVSLNSSDFSTFVKGYNAFYVSDSTTTQEIVDSLAANTIYKYRVRARNAGGISGNSASKIVLTLGGTHQPPTIAVVSATSTNLSVQTASGFNSVTNVITFLHRKITGIAFTAEPGATGSSANVLIDPLWLDQLGMEYYFRVTDEAENRDSTTRQFDYAMVSKSDLSIQSGFVPGGTSQSYRIFSIPLQLPSNSIDDIFLAINAQYGGVDKTKWRLVHYENGQNIDYGAGLNTIDPGRSYWFNSLDMPDPILLSGSVTQVNQAQPFMMSLDPGFTQIGNPFPFDISWEDVLRINANVAGINGVGNLFTYDASQVMLSKDAVILSKWGGGFVHSNTAIQLTIPVVVKQGISSDRKDSEMAARSIDQPQWFVPITINRGVSYNNFSGFGMHPDAQPGYDIYDDFTPPRFANYLEFNSYHSDYITPKFCRDIVPTSAYYNWAFDLESNQGDASGNITWDNQSLGNNEAQLLLYDVDANVIVDMKKEASYSFKAHEKRSFRIFFGVDAKSLLPDITAMGWAYPNPFTKSTKIPFITGVDRPYVQILLYDIMGRKIHEVVSGQFEPGYHEGIWDGDDDQGGRASNGIYIYRLTGTNMPAQTGRIILN